MAIPVVHKEGSRMCSRRRGNCQTDRKPGQSVCINPRRKDKVFWISSKSPRIYICEKKFWRRYGHVECLSNNVVAEIPESSSCPNPQQEYCPGCRQPPPLVHWTDHCLLLMVHFFRIKFNPLKHFDLRQSHHLCQSWIWRLPPWWRSWCYDCGSRRSRCCRVNLLPRSEVQQTGDHRNHENQTSSTPWKVSFVRIKDFKQNAADLSWSWMEDKYSRALVVDHN